MSRSLSQILWYVESKAARNEGVRLNNVEAKALAEHVAAVNERPKLLERVQKMEEALTNAEAVMSIVQPRSHKAQYLECLEQIRAALQPEQETAK
jgi:hypothetical protein